MPKGTMKWEKTNQYKCAGNENDGCLVILYDMPDGVRKDMAGVAYAGTRRRSYLPDTP